MSDLQETIELSTLDNEMAEEKVCMLLVICECSFVIFVTCLKCGLFY